MGSVPLSHAKSSKLRPQQLVPEIVPFDWDFGGFFRGEHRDPSVGPEDKEEMMMKMTKR